MTVSKLNREAIYEAAYDDAAFAALPQLIADACDARSAIVHFIGAQGDHASLAHTGQWNAEHVELYGAYASRDILLSATGHSDRLNRFWNITEDLVSHARFRRSEIWAEFYRPIGDDMRHAVGASFDNPSGLGAVGIHRGENSKPFSDAAVSTMQSLAPDLRRMLIVRSKLWTAQVELSASRAALDTLTLAILQVDRTGKVLAVNEAAEAICANTGPLQIKGGKLAVRGREAAAFLKTLSEATAASSPRAGVVSLTGLDGRRVALTVSPLPAAGAARALIVVKPAEGLQTLAARLRAFLGLTQGEAWIAAAIFHGRSVAQMAAERGATEMTVRTQIKILLSKTGCRRQVELMGLIAALPPTGAVS